MLGADPVSMGSSVPRRQLGRMLKEAREKAGFSLDGAARELEFSRNKMYRIEGGQTPVRKVDAEAMSRLYGVEPEFMGVIVAVAAETKSQGWWHAYGKVIPSWFDLYLSLEAASTRIRSYESGVLPGLLQTREYAEAIFRLRPDVTEEEVERKVSLRLERQRILQRRRPRPPQFDVLIDEAVLRRPIQDRAGMREQLAHLAEASGRPGVTVQVIPSAVGPHRASIAGAFGILEFPGGSQPEPTTVYCEGLTGALYLDRSAEVAAYSSVWQTLTGLALDPAGSRRLIHDVMEEI